MFTEAHVDTNSHDISSAIISKKNSLGSLNAAIERAKNKLLSLQNPNGYWVFELEADCTIPAEYIMMMHLSGRHQQRPASQNGCLHA